MYGDQTYFWILNDKGNIHSESQGEPIGMEIRAQAFAFSTNDEVNNMQFYNYVLINQGTQTLTDTYFAQWVDCDLGGHVDDYVGVDVERASATATTGMPSMSRRAIPSVGKTWRWGWTSLRACKTRFH